MWVEEIKKNLKEDWPIVRILTFQHAFVLLRVSIVISLCSCNLLVMSLNKNTV